MRHPRLKGWWWTRVTDAGPSLNQHWFSVLLVKFIRSHIHRYSQYLFGLYHSVTFFGLCHSATWLDYFVVPNYNHVKFSCHTQQAHRVLRKWTSRYYVSHCTNTCTCILWSICSLCNKHHTTCLSQHILKCAHLFCCPAIVSCSVNFQNVAYFINKTPRRPHEYRIYSQHLYHQEYIVASELKDPICHSNECQIGSFSSEATNYINRLWPSCTS